MEILIIYTIVFFIILITLMILYISLNPLEIKEKKIEKFEGYEEEVIVIHEPTDFQGMSPDTYVIRNVIGSTNEKYIIFKKNSSVRFPVDFPNCQILVIGGGGAGGISAGGGGGAGGLIYLTNQTIFAGSYNIIVGLGGQKSGNDDSRKGSNSSFNNLIAYGGGGGENMGNEGSTTALSYTNGGSGGGGQRTSHSNTSIAGRDGGTGVAGQGNNGGQGKNAGGYEAGGGGGGGAGGSGDSAFTTGRGANGGIGREILITGSSVYYAGGGGGGSAVNHKIAGTGGLGGGGNGTIWPNVGGNGTNGLGGGGGGGSAYPGYGKDGGAGGSGVVIIRYTPIKIEPPPTTSRNASITNLNPPSEMNNITTSKQPYTYFTKINTMTKSTNDFTQTAENEDNINYIVRFSSIGNESKSPINLFSYNKFIGNAEFGIKRYNQKTGNFDSSIPPVPIFFNIKANDGRILTINNSNPMVDGKIAGPSAKGDWISIKFPSAFALLSYSFVAILGWENKAPGKWTVLGRINNTNLPSDIPYNIIDSKPQTRASWERYGNSTQTLTEYLINNTEIYNEYLFIFHMLASTDLTNNIREGHQLNFKEILMYGRAISA